MRITSLLFEKNLNQLMTIIMTQLENKILVTKKYKFSIHTIRQKNEIQIIKTGGKFEDHVRVHEKEGGF